MDDDLLSFSEHRRRRGEVSDTVRCTRCGKSILATAVRCPECGVRFEGEAQDFAHPTDRRNVRGGPPGWVVAVAVLLLVATVAGLLGVR